MERASLALVWSEDEIEDTKPPGYSSLVFTGQSDALASYLSFSNGHNPHGKLRPGDLVNAFLTPSFSETFLINI